MYNLIDLSNAAIITVGKTASGLDIPGNTDISLNQTNTVLFFNNMENTSNVDFYFSINTKIRSMNAIIVSPGTDYVNPNNGKQGQVITVSLNNYYTVNTNLRFTVESHGNNYTVVKKDTSPIIQVSPTQINNAPTKIPYETKDITEPVLMGSVKYQFGGFGNGNPGSGGTSDRQHGGPGLVILILEHNGAILQNDASCATSMNLGTIGRWCSDNGKINGGNMFQTNDCLNSYIDSYKNKLLSDQPVDPQPYLVSDNFLALYNEQYVNNVVLFCGIVVVASVLMKMMFYPIKM
jgi:hypothetical protein